MPPPAPVVPEPPRVAVLGGGLAGMAAAAAAAAHGLRVELFEARPHLGGRAAAFVEPRTGQTLDRCQHVAMGCCTNFRQFCRQMGIEHCLRPPEGDYCFISADGRRWRFAAAPLLPAPLHLAPAVARLGFLTWRERGGVVRALGRLANLRAETTDEPLGDWLVRQRQSPQAVRRFWSPIIESALCETVEHASLLAARKVFVAGFLGNAEAYKLIRPVGLGAALAQARQRLEQGGVRVWLNQPVRRVALDARRADALLCGEQLRCDFDFMILALPWWQAGQVLDEQGRECVESLAGAAELPPAPIAAVHLWFDQPLDVPAQAMLLERTSQWLFGFDGPYCQVVISAAHGVAARPPAEVVATVCDELAAIWPASAGRLRHARVVVNRRAVHALRPGAERLRPPQETAVPNLFLAGDWTATDWPATMEGAIRSGYLAVEAILRRLGRPARLVADDLPRSWLARRWP
jgi:squalene-associated FAD-dependent desaturase